jgi:uncharacterized OB-fold protein
MAKCPNCGSSQPDGAAFCDECGAALGVELAPEQASAPISPPSPTALATVCPVCGTQATPGDAFCDCCGAALGPTTPSSAPAETELAQGPQAAATCSQCGAQLEPDSNFCDRCGTPVRAGAAQEAVPPAATAPLATASIEGHLVVEDSGVTLPFPTGRTEVVIGREDPISGIFPDIDLTPHGGDEAGVSRQHARIFVQGAQVRIEDLNSTNYTYVNQNRLTPGQPHPLNSGDEIRLGRFRLSFHAV